MNQSEHRKELFWQHRLQIVYENATASDIAMSDVAMEPVRNWMQTFWQNFLTVALCGTILTMSIITPWIERYCCQELVTSSLSRQWWAITVLNTVYSDCIRPEYGSNGYRISDSYTWIFFNVWNNLYVRCCCNLINFE